MQYSTNHYIPQVYMEGFVDPITPKGQNPYVWLYINELKRVKNKDPKSIFKVKHLYTEYDSELNPVLDFEKYLSNNVDTPFGKFKRKYEQAILQFDQEFLNSHLVGTDRFFISCFIRWQMLRTKGKFDEIVKRYIEAFKVTYPESLEHGYQDTKNFKNDVINTITSIGIEYEGVNFLESLNQRNIIFSVIETDDVSFISSDNPVLRTNPKINSQPVEDPETEFTIPLTSKIAVSLYQFGSKVLIRKMQNKREIRNINQSFAKNAYHTIFGSNKELIESLVNFIPMKEE